MTDERTALDEPRARLLAALAEHPNAIYVRVEAIDLRAALALPPPIDALTSALIEVDVASVLDGDIVEWWHKGPKPLAASIIEKWPKPKEPSR